MADSFKPARLDLGLSKGEVLKLIKNTKSWMREGEDGVLKGTFGDYTVAFGEKKIPSFTDVEFDGKVQLKSKTTGELLQSIIYIDDPEIIFEYRRVATIVEKGRMAQIDSVRGLLREAEVT